MKKKKEPCEISHLPFHISARTNNKEFFKLDLRECWDIFVDYLYGMHNAFGAKIHQFVLMSNHYHLMAAFPEGNRGEAMCWLQTQIAKEINFNSKRINHLWGKRYHGSLITSPQYYTYAHRYIYRNPVDANIVSKPWEYKYSTLPGVLGLQRYEIPQSPSKPWLESLMPEDLDGYLSWLDTEFPEGFGDFYWNSWKRHELNLNSRTLKKMLMD